MDFEICCTRGHSGSVEQLLTSPPHLKFSPFPSHLILVCTLFAHDHTFQSCLEEDNFVNHVIQFLLSLGGYHRIACSSTPTGRTSPFLEAGDVKLLGPGRQLTEQYLQGGLLTVDGTGHPAVVSVNSTPSKYSIPHFSNLAADRCHIKSWVTRPSPKKSAKRYVPRATWISADAAHNRSPAVADPNSTQGGSSG